MDLGGRRAPLHHVLVPVGDLAAIRIIAEVHIVSGLISGQGKPVPDTVDRGR
jgi:acetoacetate decarboxylase